MGRRRYYSFKFGGNQLTSHAQRKNEHLSIFEKYYDSNKRNDFDEIRLIPNLLPELGIEEIDTETEIQGCHLAHSFFINAMTGGTPRAKEINAQLALVAKKYNLAMAVGSQKIALFEKDVRDTFTITREMNPNGFLIANLNANQDLSKIKEAIKMIDANAIQLHINSPQEIVNFDGDREFKLLKNIDRIVNSIDQPVIVKSVGFGISPQDLKKLYKIGVKNVDVSGTGGTNFIKIENQQNHNLDWSYLEDFGLSTVESLIAGRNFELNLIASGGIRNPLDIIKSHVLGAKLVGISATFLHPLIKKNPEALDLLIEQWINMIPKIMLLIGKRNLTDLTSAPYISSTKVTNAVDSLGKSF